MKRIALLLMGSMMVLLATNGAAMAQDKAAEKGVVEPVTKIAEPVTVDTSIMDSVFKKLDMPLPDGSAGWTAEASQVSLERQRVIEKRRAVKVLEEQIAKAAEEFKRMSATLEKAVVQKQQDDPNLRLVVTLYESVDPKKAADMMKKLDAEMVLAIMRMMSPRKASRVLSEMDNKVAAHISRMLVERPKPGVAEASL